MVKAGKQLIQGDMDKRDLITGETGLKLGHLKSMYTNKEGGQDRNIK